MKEQTIPKVSHILESLSSCILEFLKTKFLSVCSMAKQENNGTAMDTFGIVLDKNGNKMDNFGPTLDTFRLRNTTQKHKECAFLS